MPVVRWRDASFYRDQLLLSFSATTNTGSTLNTTSGAWVIDLEQDALRLLNKTTNSGYTGTTLMVIDRPPGNSSSVTTGATGTAIIVGWYSGTTYAVDVGSSAPYTSYEAYIETDMIPVGTMLNQQTPAQVEWKTSVPLGGNGTQESIKVSYRTNLNDSFTEIGNTVATGTTVVGTTTGTTTGYAVSDYYQANFQKVQWVQLKVEMSSNSTTPTYCRLTEIRIRDFPLTNYRT
jgi:hypothetical protein